MKLLIITQKVDLDDDNLAFFHSWIKKFTEGGDGVVVITQYEGRHSLPANTKVCSLGKEKGFSKVRQLINFYRILFKNIGKVDRVFVHMIPMWVVFGSPIFKIFGKRSYLWYTHKSVTTSLKFAEKIVDQIFTASGESFRLPSKKLVVTGHGIDTDFFSPGEKSRDDVFRILSVSRISEAKNIGLMIEAVEKLVSERRFVEFVIVGGPITMADKAYFEKIKGSTSSAIKFVGPVSQEKVRDYYRKSDLFLNFSKTGSVDKAVLEAMSSGVNILTSNEAFFEMLPTQNTTKDLNKDVIAEKIGQLMNRKSNTSSLREIVVKNHNLNNLIQKLLELMK